MNRMSIHKRRAENNIFISFIIIFISTALNCLSTKAQEKAKDYQQTGLPICYINYNPATTITKEEKIDAQFIFTNKDFILKTNVKISGRGNSTWTRDKKPYNLKFEKEVSLPGMKKGRKYALLANDYDPSKMRTAIGFAISEWINTEWTLHGQYVELVINGTHKGNYYLCERINLPTLGINKDKGFILEYKYTSQLDPEGVHFTTDIKRYTMEFKDPNAPIIGCDMYNYAVQTINDFEETLSTSDNSTLQDIATKVDIDNFVKWYYAKNLLQMDECNRYYVIENYTEKTPLKMGPLWDFDWTIGWQMNETHHKNYRMRNKLYFRRFCLNTEFNKHVAALHLAFRSQLTEKVNHMYDSLTVVLRKSVALDNKTWWHTYNGNDWDEEIQTDRDYLLGTLHFLDIQLKPYMDETAVNAIQASPLPNSKVLLNGRIYILKGGDIYDSMGNKKAIKQLLEK